MSDAETIIVGGGLAGLCCARRLHQEDRSYIILEASERPGGRVRTDRMHGFILDRGFQVLLTAYPETRRVLNYAALQLKTFTPGALVRFDGRFHRVVDPWRRPMEAVASVFNPIGSLTDKIRVGRLRRQSRQGTLDELFQREETTTLEALKNIGFSSAMIERFFRPFLGGVFLERELSTSSRMLEFVFRMFSIGDAAIPANGMEEIPRQISATLPPDRLKINANVKAIESNGAVLETGEKISGKQIVVACDAWHAARLIPEIESPAFNSTTTTYFSADQAPIDDPILILNGEGTGPINNMYIPSNVSPACAPPNKSLISISVVDAGSLSEKELEDKVCVQLTEWFGNIVNDWEHLATYRIEHALPNQNPERLNPFPGFKRVRPGLIVCGDFCHSASIHGAMLSGRLAAEAIIAKDKPK